MNRFCPRFSIRSLAIFVTLVGAYFGAWEATKRYGVRSSPELLFELDRFRGVPLPAATSPPSEQSPLPFIVRHSEYSDFTVTKRYSLWLFGPRIQLPIESRSE